MEMKELNVYIEICGEMVLVGDIKGDSYRDASFCYAKEYLARPNARAISVSLPLNDEAFSATKTRIYFEGLLPEGFSRRAVANWAKVTEDDYLSILESLGRECLGAILILKKGELPEDGMYKSLSEKDVLELAREGATRSTEILMETHLSLTGASGKVGLYYDEKDNRWYLPTGKCASTHIVKQSHVRLERIVPNEYFCIKLANRLGIDTPETFVINVGNGDDENVLLATKRYDRLLNSGTDESERISPYRLHQEDFCQALGIPASEKYEQINDGYMKKMFELIRTVSSNPIEDQLKLWDMIVVNFLLGNTDSHIKNFALLYSDDMKTIRLAPAYDMVCTTMYRSTTAMSFYIGGKLDITSIGRNNFKIAASEIGIGSKVAMEHYDKLYDAFPDAVNEVAKELESQGVGGTEEIRNALLKRTDILTN